MTKPNFEILFRVDGEQTPADPPQCLTFPAYSKAHAVIDLKRAFAGKIVRIDEITEKEPTNVK